MKKAFLHLFILLLAVLICNDQLISQQQTPSAQPEYPIGAFKLNWPSNRYNANLYESFAASGMNTIWVHIDRTTKQLMTNNNIENVIGYNTDGSHELINYYGTAHYSKWEAEENQQIDTLVGIKHKYGDSAIWKNNLCWSSIGLTSQKDSLMYGPHYYQEKLYHRYYDTLYHQDPYDLPYIPRYSMALDYDTLLVSQEENVCVIKVVNNYYKYTLVAPGVWSAGELRDTIFLIDTLKVSRFSSDGSFVDITFPSPDYYRYSRKYEAGWGKGMTPPPQKDSVVYIDIEPGTGIQFCVEWLRDDTLATLYIDYVEVYDRRGWEDFLDNPVQIAQDIKDYAYEQVSNFPNLQYFDPGGEPHSLDRIIPIKVVDSLIQDRTGKGINLGMTIETPEYWPYISGIKRYQRILDEVQPEKMLVNYFPFYVGWDLPKSYEYLRAVLQESHNVYPDFWYCAQSEGYRTNEGNGDDWCEAYKPDSTEMKASVMLGLSHGAKGILFWAFDSFTIYNPSNVIQIKLNIWIASWTPKWSPQNYTGL
jgi:hypothetical protein